MVNREHRIRAARQEDAGALGGVLAAAFHDDPVWAWMVPDPGSRKRRLGEVFTALVESGIARGDTMLTTDLRSGAAIWRAPGHRRESGLTLSLLARIVAGLGPGGVLRMLRLGRTIQKHRPRKPHWYLELLGTAPAHQGTGVGSALLREVTANCDRDHLPAYLETEVLENVEFYSRHGFDVTAETDVPFGGPHFWLMWREPRDPTAETRGSS